MPFVKVNLLPPRIKQAQAKRMMMTIAVAVGVGVMAMPVGWWYVRWSKLASIESELADIKQEAKKFGDVIGMNERLNNRETELAGKLENLDKMVSRQAGWIKIMEALSMGQAQATDLWLTNVTSKLHQSGKDKGKVEVTVQGRAFSIASLDEFVKTIMESELKPESAETELSQQSAVGGRTIIGFTTKMKIKV